MPRQPTKAELAAERHAARRRDLFDEADVICARAGTPVEVIACALALVDRLKASPPVGGGMALAGAADEYAEAAALFLARYPKESPMPDPAAEPERAITLPSLAEQNATAIRAVEARIATLVAERARINAEVGGLRGSLVALQAANRHFVKLGAQLALPVGDDGVIVAGDAEGRCSCGEPTTEGVTHRYDGGPCYDAVGRGLAAHEFAADAGMDIEVGS